MAMDLIARLREQRRHWVYLDDADPARAVSFLRPPETVMFELASRGGIGLDEVCRFVDGWRGITEADIVPGIGADTAAAFSPELFREWLQDKAELMAKLAAAIAAAVDAHLARARDAGKN